MDDAFLHDIEALAERDGRYSRAAYLFVYDALQHTVEKLGKASMPREQRHVSGRDLIYGISECALDQFGPLTLTVFDHWGIRETRDFGEIVFNLVNDNLMSKTDDDRIEDFTDVFEFDVELDWKRRRSEFRRPEASTT
ncbi:MAG: Minf_1886 family protein [Candidatus Latescibacterota bacterium]